MIYNRLNWYLESHSFLAEEQAGFRRSRSTSHHVTLFSQALKDVLDSRQVFTAIAVDLKSAYDTVWKENLLLKLYNMGITGHMLNWIKSFIGQCLCRVRYGTKLSKYGLLQIELPQRAVLSRILFIYQRPCPEVKIYPRYQMSTLRR
nr:uncharacterized protein LOC107445258 [Parasteatoda tepidariorum]